MNRLTAMAVVAVSLLGCKTTEPSPQPAPEAAPKKIGPPVPAPGTKAEEENAAGLPMPAGLDESALNPTADPCGDFYQYACGGWLQKTEIPPDRPRWSRGFITVEDRNEKILHAILEDLAAGRGVEETAYGRKLADFYGACMDEPKLEQALPALQARLKTFDRIKDAKSLTAAIAELHRQDVEPLFQYGATQDLKDATQEIGEVDQGGLGLPDRDFYLKDDPKTKEVRALYLAYAGKVFQLLGEAPKAAEADAQTVLDLETALAKASMSKADRRDPKNVYHRLDRPGLLKAAPSFGWDAYFAAIGTPSVQAINVTSPEFFGEVDRLVRTRKPAEWRKYLAFAFVRSAPEALPKAFRDAHFEFDSKALSGTPEDLPRWKKCVAFTDDGIGEALARPFVARTFGPEGKQKTSEMVAEIEKAFEGDLGTLDWMDAPTKARALEKLRKIYNKIGYPDRWRNYDKLAVDRGSFLDSLLNAQAFEKARRLDKIGKPVDKTEWLMTPPTVNAYYTPLFNEIVFPAGILQPPYFNREAGFPVNFGAIGMVVGHETTHGFDDEGRLFDPEGNLHEWWTPASDEAFRAKASCVEKQYSNEVAIDDIHLNGKLTLGENIADLGGIKLAYLAMKDYATKNPPLPRSRFTPEQQFFLGFAQSWCTKQRPEFSRVRAVTDPHSPPFLRVNVPLRNFPGFAEAWHCGAGKPMAPPPAERCEVW